MEIIVELKAFRGKCAISLIPSVAFEFQIGFIQKLQRAVP